MSIKQKILDLLDFAQREEQTWIDGLTDEERAFEGSLGFWSAKDTLAHLYAWKVHFVKNLDRVKAGEAWEQVSDVDTFNAAVYEAHHKKAWGVVLSEWEQANAELRKHAEAFTEDDLTDPKRFPGADTQLLWHRFTGIGIIHTALHLGEFYARRGELDRANALHQTMVNMLLDLDDSNGWRGVTLYNLACHYAITGQSNTAISYLNQSFASNPSIVAWSKQDPDLKSLRELAAYRALYEAYPAAD